MISIIGNTAHLALDLGNERIQRMRQMINLILIAYRPTGTVIASQQIPIRKCRKLLQTTDDFTLNQLAECKQHN